MKQSAKSENNVMCELTQSMMRETMNINVEGCNQTVYKDEWEKQLYKELYNQLNIGLKSAT